VTDGANGPLSPMPGSGWEVGMAGLGRELSAVRTWPKAEGEDGCGNLPIVFQVGP
jgi:hypothetical protein